MSPLPWQPSFKDRLLLRISTDWWLKRGWWAWMLRDVSFVYGWAAQRRHRAFASGKRAQERLPVPVIVVGNVVAGGAGKTPTTLAVVAHLAARGLRVGVVSAGHGRDLGATAQDALPIEVDADADPRRCGDEPLLMAQRLAPAAVPVFVAAHRAGAARALLLAYPQTQILVCDDGLQHRQLSRDVEITVFDERGIGNGWPLPAGPLREPWPPLMESAYKGDRPIAIGLHTGATRALNLPGWDAKRSLAGEAYNAAGERRALSSFGAAADGEPALAEPRVKREANSEANSKANTVQTVAVAGIARPQAFFDMLREQGVALDATVALADHCSFESTNTTVNPRQTLICTEKDAVKLWKTHPAAWAVPLHLTPESGFFDVLDAAVDGLLAVKVAE